MVVIKNDPQPIIDHNSLVVFDFDEEDSLQFGIINDDHEIRDSLIDSH